MDALLQTEMVPSGSDTLESLWLPTSSSSVLQGAKSMVGCYENGEDQCDDSCSRPVKKRRLSCRQVESLERHFAVENKLEPERKLKLAKELGMQPRQVAIWFQNRRARFKNKQLEKDYDLLKSSYDKLKADCDNLLKENEALRTEVLGLKQKLPGAKGKLKGSIPDFDGLNVKKSCKVEESDVVDSDSTANGTGFCYAVVPDQAAFFCKDEMGNLNKRLVQQPPMFPSFQLECFYDHPLASFSGFGLTVEDQTLWSSLC